jgi:hypothetical protein
VKEKYFCLAKGIIAPMRSAGDSPQIV